MPSGRWRPAGEQTFGQKEKDMSARKRLRVGLVAVSLAFCLALAGSVGAQEQKGDKEKPATAKPKPAAAAKPAPAPKVNLGALTGTVQKTGDPLAICAGFPLDAQKKQALAALQAEREQEKQKVLADLDNKFAQRAKTEVLAGDQVAQMDAVMAAGAECRAAVAAAAAELETAAGAKGAKSAAYEGQASVWGLVSAMDLNADQMAAVSKLRTDMGKAVEDAAAAVAKPADAKDKKAAEEHAAAVKAARDKVGAEYNAKLTALLNDQQKAELTKVQAAQAAYRAKIEAARKALTDKLAAAFAAK